MPGSFRPEQADGADLLVSFELRDDATGRYWVHVQSGVCRTGSGAAPRAADAVVRAAADDWLRISNGQLNPVVAGLLGKVKIDGQVDAALQIARAFARG